MPLRTVLAVLGLTCALSLLTTPANASPHAVTTPANARSHAVTSPSPPHHARLPPTPRPASPRPALQLRALPEPHRPPPADTLWRWPLGGNPEIIRRFSPPPAPWLAGHRGVDLAAPPATPVLSAGPGSIGFAAPVAGRGVVTVNHPGGLRTTYLPVTPAVRRGDLVSTGDLLGTLATAPPHCPESCLHWGLREGTTYLNPLLLLTGLRIRLLPYWRSDPPAATPPQQAARPSPSQRSPTFTPGQATSPAHPTEPPDPHRLPTFLARSTTGPLPEPYALLALLAALLLLGSLLHLVRTRTRRRRQGKHTPHPPTKGQHRKQRPT
ncbi:M23 family metallopeptidase [Nonomuraea sp. NPDC048826]|uniref:M23 family metallopeptidase n=1 Tax=Nonomuraea sp. NPDC048826 TaxID=3364347 RepID=UPI003711A54E